MHAPVGLPPSCHCALGGKIEGFQRVMSEYNLLQCGGLKIFIREVQLKHPRPSCVDDICQSALTSSVSVRPLLSDEHPHISNGTPAARVPKTHRQTFGLEDAILA